MNAITVIEDTYVAYLYAWGIQGSQHGACLAVVEELVAHGLAVDDKTGLDSLEARIKRVADEHIIDTDGRVHAGAMAAEVALALGLATRDEASDYAGCELAG